MCTLDTKQFGVFLATERKAKGLTQKELAEKVGVTDKAVSKWERGVCLPDVSKFDDIASALDLTDLEVLRAKRLPPVKDAISRETPPLVQGRECGVLLLGFLVAAILCFPGQMFEMLGIFKIIPLSAIIQVTLSAGFSIWYALRQSQGNVCFGWRQVCDWILILAVLGTACVILLNRFDLVWCFPMWLMKVDVWSWKELVELWGWSPLFIIHWFLRLSIFDLYPIVGLFLCLALFPTVKLSLIYMNYKKNPPVQFDALQH